MNELTPHCIVVINNKTFNSWKGENLISAEVNLTTDKSGEGVIEPFDPNFNIIDGIFNNGLKAVSAAFYFGWEMDLGQPYFTGILARTEWNDNITTLRFHDRSIKMKQGRKTRYHKKKSDYQILKDIAAEHDLKFEVKSSFPESEKFDSLMQTSTDWEFAKKIASESGLNLYVKNNTLYAVEAGKTKPDEIVSILKYESDYGVLRGFGLSYKLPENPKTRPKAVEVRGRGKHGKRLTGKIITNQRGRTDVHYRDSRRHSTSSLHRKAKGKLGKKREYAFNHNLKTLPSFRRIINLRDTVKLTGIGAFYSGNYIVTEISYLFSSGSLICELTVGTDKKVSKE